MSPTIERDIPADELDHVRAGRLPARYDHPMQAVFLDRVDRLMRPGVRILDIGSGRAPTIPPADRPEGCRYVGTDIDPAELEAAPEGSYDLAVGADATQALPIDEQFDVILSWQVLEHVDSMADALGAFHDALVPGGTVIAQLSGSRAIFALLARALPHRVRVLAMTRLLGHVEEEKFPTRYDACTDKALRGLLQGWSNVEIVPFYRGGSYFLFSHRLLRGYLAYENLVARRDMRGLATHYLVVATR